MGQVLRIQGCLVGGHGDIHLGPPALGVLLEQGQGPGRPEDLLLAQWVGVQAVVQGLPVEEPVLPSQHHVLLGRHVEHRRVQGGSGGDHLLPEGEVVGHIVGDLVQHLGVEAAVLQKEPGRGGQGLVGRRLPLGQ